MIKSNIIASNVAGAKSAYIANAKSIAKNVGEVRYVFMVGEMVSVKSAVGVKFVSITS
jgi:hypothetical protein